MTSFDDIDPGTGHLLSVQALLLLTFQNTHHVIFEPLRDKPINLGGLYPKSDQSIPLRERLRTHKVFTKDHSFYLNYHKFSIKSYVLDVY